MNEWTDRRTASDELRELIGRLDSISKGEAAHGGRVAVYAAAMGSEMGLDLDELLNLRYAAELHDIGKLLVPPGALNAGGPLSNDHREGLMRHPELAADVLGAYAWAIEAIPLIRSHHERWDGTGYPDRLSSQGIPLGSRVIAAAEAYDVLTVSPPWRTSVSEDAAMEEIRGCAGTQFDPDVVDALDEVRLLIQPLIV